MRRAAITVGLSVLLVLAGCIGGSPTSDGPTTTAETAGPTTEATTTAGETPATDGQYPPGVSADGVANVSALLDANAGRLADAGFVLRSTYEVDGTDGFSRVRETTAAAGLDRVRAEVGSPDDARSRSTWANGTMVLNRLTGEDDVEYQGRKRPGSERRPTAMLSVAGVLQVERVLAGGEFAVENATGEDGDRRVTLRATAFEGNNYGTSEATVVVDGDGVVRSASATGVRDDHEFTFEYDLERFGVEGVEPPAWVADAPAPIDPDLDFSFENCTDTYLELTHRGGDALPAGSTITIETANATHEVVLDDAIDEETRYFYVDRNGELHLTTDAPPTDRGSVGNEVSVSVATGDGYQVLNAGMGFGCESATDGGSEGGSSGSGSSGSASASG